QKTQASTAEASSSADLLRSENDHSKLQSAQSATAATTVATSTACMNTSLANSCTPTRVPGMRKLNTHLRRFLMTNYATTSSPALATESSSSSSSAASRQIVSPLP